VSPVLLLDDVFAELDSRRQQRLAARLLDGAERQVIVTAPRTDELPGELDLPVWTVHAGVATPGT
jgi:DNA replication and repair protein RecF